MGGVHPQVYGLLALHDAYEVAGDDSPLVDELVEGVLPVGARLTKVNFSGLKWQPLSSNRDSLAIALHRHLDTIASARLFSPQSNGIYIPTSSTHYTGDTSSTFASLWH